MSLKDVIGERAAEELLEEVNILFQQVKSFSWKELRPWSEFFAAFKLPQLDSRNIELRMTTNFLHYRSNYFALCCGIICIQMILAPVIILTLILTLSFSAYILYLHKKPVVVGSFTIDATLKKYLCALVCFILLVLTGTLAQLVWNALYCIALCGIHMILRPRSVTSKSNKVYEETKLNAFSIFGGSHSNFSGNSGRSKAFGDQYNGYDYNVADPENPASSPHTGFSSSTADSQASAAMRKRGGPTGSAGTTASGYSTDGSVSGSIYERKAN